MKTQKLGRSDIDVSVVALGTWGLGGGSVWSDRDSTVGEAKSLLDACKDFGINYIDTAPVYGTGVSETLLGEALKRRRHDFVLQTKCSFPHHLVFVFVFTILTFYFVLEYSQLTML